MSKKVRDEIAENHIKTSIGGQALIEGIMMRGPKMTAMAVRDPDGVIVLEKWETVGGKRAKILRLPFIRGIFNFIDSMKFGYKCLMRSAEISGLDDEASTSSEKKAKATAEETKAADDAKTSAQGETETPADNEGETQESKETSSEDKKDDKNKKKGKDSVSMGMAVIEIVSVILSFAILIGLFIWLPLKIYEWMPDSVFSPDNRYLRSVFTGVCKVILLVGYMAIMLLMKDIRRTFMYHGAEHKTIFCYEAGLELTVENVRKMKRFHPRCGTSFLILMVLVSIFIGFLIPPTWSTPVQVVVKLALVPLIVGIGYELIKFAGRHDNFLTHLISLPGIWLQHITVLEPDDSMIECAIAAVKEVIPDDGSDRW